jgi:hypothetical protein
MKKINKLQPNIMVGMEFNIPVFSAHTQLYVCTEVADMGSDAESKKYGLYFRWLPTSYNVPEILRLDIIIQNNHNTIDMELYEKNETGNYIKIHHRIYSKENIASIQKIKNTIIDLTSK